MMSASVRGGFVRRRVVVAVSVLALVAVSVTMNPGQARADDDNQHKCFVIGDTSGNKVSKPLGGKKNPYGTLAAVEADPNCDKIIVLYSGSALDGGIQLQDGQKLVGREGPGGSLPVITNSTAANHDGTSVVLANRNKVKDIHIADSYGYGIVAQNVTGGLIKGVRITNHNTANLPSAGGIGAFPGSRAAIYVAALATTGSHTIRDVTISDAGSVAIDVVGFAGADLDVTVASTTIKNITGFNGQSNHPGVIATAFDPGTNVDLVARDLHVDNVASFSSGIVLSAVGGALRTHITRYEYEYSRGTYSLTPNEAPRYGIESVTLPGSVNEVLVEHSSITGAGGSGYVAFDPCSFDNPLDPCDNPHPGSIVDLGGGPLGSDGQNSIAGNGQQGSLPRGIIGGFELFTLNAIVHAEHNWWGTSEPAEVAAKMLTGPDLALLGIPGWGGEVDFTPFLQADPFADDGDADDDGDDGDDDD